MYRNLLVPTDGSSLSRDAAAQAIAFAQTMGARVTVLTVVEPFHFLTADPQQLESTHEEYDRHADETAKLILEQVCKAAADKGVACEPVQVRSNDPAQAIANTAKEKGCDLIVMASHGREGFKAFMIGSVTMKVLASSKIPTLVHR